MSDNISKYKPLLWPSLIAIPALIILVILGTWQVHRLEYKTKLLQQIDSRITLQAVSLPLADKWRSMTRDSWHFTPVSLAGQFDHENEFHVFTHISDDKGRFLKAGYYVVTPLKLRSSDKYIFISRGFVPEAQKSSETRSEGQVEGIVELEGLLRFPERKNMFTPEPDLNKNIWFIRDTQSMQRILKKDNFAPFFIELKESKPQTSVPIARAERPDIKNNHLSYAITWYGIALGLLAIYFLYCFRHIRRLK